MSSHSVCLPDIASWLHLSLLSLTVLLCPDIQAATTHLSGVTLETVCYPYNKRHRASACWKVIEAASPTTQLFRATPRGPSACVWRSVGISPCGSVWTLLLPKGSLPLTPGTALPTLDEEVCSQPAPIPKSHTLTFSMVGWLYVSLGAGDLQLTPGAEERAIAVRPIWVQIWTLSSAV